MASARLPSLGAIALLIVAVVLLLRDGGSPGDAGAGQPGGRIRAEVVEVTDGDTIRVKFEGGEEKVRYIGIDTPESAIPGQVPECFGERAAEINDRLVGGRRVRLVAGAERRDRYGRLLAYVHVGDLFVNAELLERGAARTLEIAPNTRFAERFARLQQAAANAGLGLWGAC